MSDRPHSVRILLVDDDHALLDALAEALSLRAPWVSCDATDSAFTALDLLASRPYDVVISDIKMPVMDGLQLLNAVREQYPALPVLLITGHGETDLAVQALRAGAYDLLHKPLDREYLVNAVGRAAEAHRLRVDVEAQKLALQGHAEELERRVEERTAQLQQASRVKDEFLGLVSHELRTPITVILGNAELLVTRDNRLSEDIRRQALTDLRADARRLQRIVENLLVLARPDHGQVLEPEPMVVHRAIEAQVLSHRRAFPKRPITVNGCQELPLVEGHPTHVELILANLLSNAEKYSPPLAPIAIECVLEDMLVKISVNDCGPGFNLGEAEDLFKPFYRSPATADSANGLGIGLTVCKRLVEASGGEIWARSRAQGGAEFGFSLRILEEANPVDNGAVNFDSRSGSGRPGAAESAGSARRRA